MTELPKITIKQQQFVLHYTINGGNASEAYRSSYDCSSMSPDSVRVEASKLLKNPNIALWIDKAESNKQEVFREELKYSVKDCFDELVDLQSRCKKSSKTYNIEKGCIELKGKLAGHFIDRHQVSGGLADVLEQLK